MDKRWTYTASWLAFYLIFFFTLGTMACTSTTTHRIKRSEFEKLSDSSGLKSRPIMTLNAEEIRVTESSKLLVDGSDYYRNLVPFHFSLNGDLITPSSEGREGINGIRAVKDTSPFTLKPTDRFMIRATNVDGGRTAGTVGGTVLILGLLGVVLVGAALVGAAGD